MLNPLPQWKSSHPKPKKAFANQRKALNSIWCFCPAQRKAISRWAQQRMNRDTAFDQRRPRVILWRTIIFLAVYLFAARIVLECLKYHFQIDSGSCTLFIFYVVSKFCKGYVTYCFHFFANYVNILKFCLKLIKWFLKHHIQNSVKVI